MKTKKTYKISHMLTDNLGDLSLRNLSSLMFDVAFSQAGEVEKDIDMDRLRWIVYRRDIDLLDPINLGDEIEITTIPTHMNKFYAYREFFVKRRNTLVAKARAQFMLIDIRRLRPIKIPKDLEKAYGREEVTIMGEDISYDKDLAYKGEIYVRRADLDTNNHVNNGVYFDYIKDLTGLDDKDIAYINITYRNEIRNKKKIYSYMKKDRKVIDFALEDEDGKIYCQGKINLHV
ncbi:MAG: thioesterase [Anaerococcus sp.]|nr:thioesterase [Anaerococcus sp.]